MSIDPSLSLAFRYASSTLLKLGTLRHMQSSYQRFESYLELEQLGVFSQEDIRRKS